MSSITICLAQSLKIILLLHFFHSHLAYFLIVAPLQIRSFSRKATFKYTSREIIQKIQYNNFLFEVFDVWKIYENQICLSP